MRVWVVPLTLLVVLQDPSLLCMAADSAQEAVVAPKSIAELERAIEHVLLETNTPGVSIAIISPDEPLYASGFGVADRTSKKMVTTETMFRAGSISKSFTALAILQLQEAGKLELNARVRDLAPDVQFSNRWEETEPLRLVHLLEHTGGFDEISFREFATNKLNSRLSEDINFDPNPRSVRWPPGQFFSYSNADYTLAGYIVEKVSGQSFDEFVSEQLIEPLEMPGATFLYDARVRQQLATGYTVDGVTAKEYEHILGRPSGALNCTPTELSHLVQLLINRGIYNGRRILSEESILRMETPTTSLMAQRGIRDGYGLANYSTSHKGYRIHGHSGGMNGYSARYGYSAEHGAGYVFMINGVKPDAFKLIEALILNYLSRSWPQPVTVEPVRLDKQQLARYVGVYEPHTPRFEKSRFLFRLLECKEVAVHNGTLRWRGLLNEWKELKPFQVQGAFGTLHDAGPTLLFTDQDGQAFLSSAQLQADNLRRVPTWVAWGQTLAMLYCALVLLSALLFLFIWLPRKLLGYMRGVKYLYVRVLPLLATASFLGIFAIIMAGMDDAINMFAEPTIASIGICVLTWLLAVLAPLALIGVFVAPRAGMNRWVWWHSLHVSIANIIVLSYLAYWGIIGVRTWV